MNDTLRLEWYARHVADTDESLASRQQADRVMGITAMGEATFHRVWYWPMDSSSIEFDDLRKAIDWKMTI